MHFIQNFFLFLLLALFTSCGEDGKSVEDFIVDFNNAIVDELNPIADQLDVLFQAMKDEDHREIQLRRTELVKMCKESKLIITNLESYGGDNRFRNAALDMIERIKKFAINECASLEQSLLYADRERLESAQMKMEQKYREIQFGWDNMKQSQLNFEQRAVLKFLK